MKTHQMFTCKGIGAYQLLSGTNPVILLLHLKTAQFYAMSLVAGELTAWRGSLCDGDVDIFGHNNRIVVVVRFQRMISQNDR